MWSKIIEDNVVYEVAKNIGVKSSDIDDFVQEIWVILLEYDSEKMQGIIDRGEFKFFLSRIMINQYHSKTSPFYTRYKKFNNMVAGNNLFFEEDDIEFDEWD